MRPPYAATPNPDSLYKVERWMARREAESEMQSQERRTVRAKIKQSKNPPHK